MHAEGSKNQTSNHMHRELEKLKFMEFLGSMNDQSSWSMARKGNTLLWWKTLLPQLGMDISEVSWEFFEDKFKEYYLPKFFIKGKLNKFNALRWGGISIIQYEARFMDLLWHASHLNTEKLRVNKLVYGMNCNIQEQVRILMLHNSHEVV